MNTEKPRKRQRKICECGQTFWTTAKFGNEEKCDACYKRRSEEFRAWFDAQSNEEQREMLACAIAFAAALGVDVPALDEPQEETPVVSDVDDSRQSHCDVVAAELLEEVEI